MNRREECVLSLRLLLAELQELHPGETGGEELLLYAREGAAHVERFLHRSLRKNSGTLNELVNELAKRGLPEHAVDSLHAIRKSANRGKHDPDEELPLDTARDLLSRAVDAISTVGVECEAPGANEEVRRDLTSELVVLVFDYPRVGEVEYLIGWLLENGKLVRLDLFQARYDDEDNIIRALETSGELDRSPVGDRFDRVVATFANSNDFSGLWIYQGTPRHLVEAFAPYQQSEAIPPLQRDYSSTSVRTAAAIAVVDLGLPEATGSDAIIRRLESHFAIGGPIAESFAAQFALLVARVDVGTELAGPRLRSSLGYRSSLPGALASDDELMAAIGLDGTMVLDVGRGSTLLP